jgi:CRISPR-associated endonuclease/helicase Cas3
MGRLVWAHSANGKQVRHALSAHLEATGELAGGFAAPFGARDLAYALGLLHDAGKAGARWQARLAEVDGTDQPVRVPHKELGTRLAWPFAGPLAGCVLGHHGGLRDRGDVRAVISAPEVDRAAEAETVEALAAQSPAVASLLKQPGLLVPEDWRRDASVCEMGARLVFSALVDADHLDTAAHSAGLPSPSVRSPTDMGVLLRRFESGRSELLAGRAPSPIDAVRQEVYEAAVRAAGGPTGVYRLPAPTGSGKTLASAAFALHHAARAGKRRVVVAVPFLTITEQNAQVYRRLLGEDVVLEHHCGVALDEGGSARARRQRLAAENWDSPFVVTTTVQLFDSLFGRKPARSRKLHRLADAVLVLDEVQALPQGVLPVILEGLKVLSRHFGTTVLLASATQPAFQELGPWRDLAVTDVVAGPARLYERLSRVRYEWRTAKTCGGTAPSVAEIADEVTREGQALVVVSRVADARQMFRLLRERSAHPVRHLSTRMCPAHRRAVLADVVARLRAGTPVLLVSTQLIEAGVDVDFPTVFRAVAPAESLQQAAGRANREGRLPGGGRVVVFDAAEWPVPRFYRTAVAHTERVFGPGQSPDDPVALKDYYTRFYESVNLEGAPRAAAVHQARLGLNFQSVAEGPDTGDGRDRRLAFRMIDEDTVPVVVPLDNVVRAELAQLLDGSDEVARSLEVGNVTEMLRQVRAGAADRALFRRLQAVTVALPGAIARNDRAVAALLEPVVGDLWEWRGAYDLDLGLDDSDVVRDCVW